MQRDDLVSIDNTKSDYVNAIKQALINLEELQRYNESMKNMDVSVFDNVINYTDDSLQEKLNGFVNKYINLNKLNLSDDKLGSDRFSVLYQHERTLKHKDEISCIMNLKNGTIATGSFDTTIKIWEPNTGKCRRILDGHTHVVL